MSNVLIVARRELKSYFDSAIAYIVIVVFLGVSGYFFFKNFFMGGRVEMRPLFDPGYLFSPSMVLVLLIPALSMRLISEERKSGTLELLATMPIRDVEIILGKFFGALALLAIALLFTLAYPLTVDVMRGDLDWGPVFSGYLGLVLFSASLLSIGLWCSTVTSNQIVAFIISLLLCGTLYFIYMLQFWMPDIAELVEYLSVSYHLRNLARGVIDSRDLVYFLSLTTAGILLSVRALSRQQG